MMANIWMFLFNLLVIANLIAFANAYWRMQCGVIDTGRIDPAVSPGKISGHAHKISGGSNIGLSSTYSDMMASSCTSCEITADRSAYWTPQLYYQHANGSFEEVPNSGMVIYYLGRGDNAAYIKPFPPDLMMVSGDSNVRSYDSSKLTYEGVRPIADRVSFACLDSSSGMPEQPYMFRTDCDYGLRAQVHFQSCWNGVDLYKPDSSHVAYMSQIDNGACPPTHPVQFVHLFFEILYSTNSIKQDSNGTFVFANGDATGYGFHGDFLNGWNMNVQAAALRMCANVDNGGEVDKCPPLNEFRDPYYNTNCPPRSPLVNEPARGMIDKLPGCNKVTFGPERATSSDTVCPPNTLLPDQNPFTPSQFPTVYFNPQPGYTESGWEYLGCADELDEGRALDGVGYANSTSMSNQLCTEHCASKGYQFAGTEYGQECYCGNSLPTLNAPSSCDSTPKMVCPGNSSTYCGAPSLLSVWNSTAYVAPPSPSPFPDTNSTTLSFPNSTSPTPSPGSVISALYLSCYHEPPTLTNAPTSRALSADKTTSPNMTNTLCGSYCGSKGYDLFGTEYGLECYCGNMLATGSYAVASSECDTPCPGNSSQYCGSSLKLSVWNIIKSSFPSSVPPGPLSSSSSSTAAAPSILQTVTATATAIPNPSPSSTSDHTYTYIYLGCYLEGSGGIRALPNLTTKSHTAMTPSLCAGFCSTNIGPSTSSDTSSSSPPPWLYAGVEQGSDCWCGDELYGGSMPAGYGDRECRRLCGGDPGLYCGGRGRLGLYKLERPKEVEGEIGGGSVGGGGGGGGEFPGGVQWG